MSTVESPRAVVDDVSIELDRLSSLLNVLAQIQNGDSEVNLTDFGITMGVLRDYLDVQIKALDSIRWKPERQ